MTLRKLPEIKAFERIDGLTFEPEPDALAKWTPEIRAASGDDANTITIYDTIGDDPFGDSVSVKRIAAALRSIGNNPVTVAINSPGGDFFDGVAIYNLFREHPAEVTVKILGLAASAASVIAMAGDTIEISEVGFMMIHNAWAIAIGNRHDMAQAAEILAPFDDAMATLYAKRSGVDKAEAAAWMDEEKWFSGQQAIDAGMADRLLSDDEISEGAQASVGIHVAKRRIETMLRKHVSSSEAKRLIAQATGDRDDHATHAMRDDGDITADIKRLTQLIRA